MVDYRVKTFLVLYDTMNYRAAAAKLNLTQPAVTQQIQTLEREYGCKLFHYDRRRLTRTPAAEQFSIYCRGLLYNEARFRSELSAGVPETMRIGATKTIGEFVLADAVARYLRQPENAMELSVDNTKNLLTQLENGKLDFALVEGNFDKKLYGSRLFRNEPFVGICAKGHRFAGQAVSFAELLDNTLILREEGSGTRAILEQLLGNFGYGTADFSRSVCISSFSLIRRLVAGDIGISFVYKAIADASPDLAVFRMQDMPVIHEFNYVYLKNTNADRMIDRFSKCFFEEHVP